MTKEEAEKICERVREKNKGKWWKISYWQCWGCAKFSSGDIDKRYCATPDGQYPACPWMNKERTINCTR